MKTHKQREISKLIADLKEAGYKQKDAKKSLSLLIGREHIRGAVQKDFMNCAIAKGVCSVLGAQTAAVYKTIALIIRRDTKEVLRYLVSGETAKAIADFDVKGVFVPGVYTLDAVTPSKTVGARRAFRKSRNEKIRKGEHVVKKHKKKYRAARALGVRNGSGLGSTLGFAPLGLH